MRRHVALAMLLIVSAVVGAASSRADEMEFVPPVTHQATIAECGTCHMAYQPALLPRESWAAIMDDLSNHFGEDASLPTALAAEIKAYLVGASVPARRPSAEPILKITEQPWWRHEHDEIPAATWQSPKVVAKGNCGACHRFADRGIYDDDEWDSDD